MRYIYYCRSPHPYSGQLLQRGLPLLEGPIGIGVSVPHTTSTPISTGDCIPLRPEAWERTFHAIPDKALTSFLRRGIHQGFRIGVAQGAPFKPAKRNLKSAYEQPDTITAYIQREVDLGRMGPLPRQPALTPPLLQISPFGVIPKKNRPDKW